MMRTRLVAALLAVVAAGCAGPTVRYPATHERDAVLIVIPAGETQIGDNAAPPDERPAFRYRAAAFLMDRTPVTVAQFRAFVEETGYVTDAERFGSAGVLDYAQGAWIAVPGADWRHPTGPDGPLSASSHPVTQVSWRDADIFCRAYRARLPTELEWERAARLGQTRDGHVFRVGDPPVDRAGHFAANVWQGLFPLLDTGEDGYRGTSPVGAFGAAPSGLTDMAGNVWEWTDSWYVPYSALSRLLSGGGERVRRGGSFLCDPTFCQGYRVTARGHSTPDTSLINVGFRCVADPDHLSPLAGRRAQVRT
jgi:sulfatase modifying factor 1